MSQEQKAGGRFPGAEKEGIGVSYKEKEAGIGVSYEETETG